MEIKTQEQILQELLSNISDIYAKNEGTLTYDIPSSVSIELASMYIVQKALYNMIDVDLLISDALTKFVKQRKGIIRKEATFSIGELQVTGNGTVLKGAIFESETGVQFEATETVNVVSSAIVPIKCLQSGIIGNLGANSIRFMPVTIQGITVVTNPQPTYDGFEQESDSSLRERYYLALQTPPTSGNIYHYELWANSVSGVGGARVFALWAGDNTVKVLIINSEKQPASQEVVQAVQTYIDPNASGEGRGQAPIGAYCTVQSATGLNINISFTAQLEQGFTIEEAKSVVESEVKEYLKTVAFKQDYVSYNQIASLIFNTEAIRDFSNYTLNGLTGNVDVLNTEVAILGNVTISL